jgi:RNA polymerase sigma-70 factor (ECF subfamily)
MTEPGHTPLTEEAYAELRRIAARYLSAERPDHTLQPTALVNEAFVRLDASESGFADRRHFIAAAARAMRNILVDHARARGAQKRGAGKRVALDVEAAGVDDGRGADVIALDEALGRLEALHPRQARIVELRFFGGLTGTEIGVLLEVSERTVERDWVVARAWLRRELKREGEA